jgi:DNA-binding CsgD family transcriptional regulator
MGGQAVNLERLQEATVRLGDAAIDPTIWPEIMEQVSVACGAAGAALLQSDLRTPDIPRTAGVDDCFRSYFADEWHLRDIRAERGVPLLLRGERAVIDQDILTPEEMRRAGLYAECLRPHGLQWFAVVGFRAGPVLWGLSIQRTLRQGAFDHHDKRVLAQLSQRLTETATLSLAVGRTKLTGMTNALELVNQPALALDRSGFVLDMNAAAERILDDEVRVRNRRLCVRDRQANAALDALIDRLRTTPDTAALPGAPIVVQRSKKRPLVVRVMPVDGAACIPFLGARVLLVLSDLDGKPLPDAALIARLFGLSPAETRLASLIVAGLSLVQAAEELGVVHETVRTHLKAMFDKTGTRRQSELVAMLARVSRFSPSRG